MARRPGIAKRSEVPVPVRIVRGPRGPVPKALRGRGVVTMKVSDLTSRRYDAGKSSNATRDQWRGADGAPINADIALDIKTVRARARHEAQNNPNLAGAKVILGAHGVGRNGPTLQLRTADRKFADRLAPILTAYMEHAGADGRSLVDHLLDAVRGIPQTGEILWQIVSEAKATPIAARVHPLNSSHISTPTNKTESQTMRLGVERTKTNKPVRFWAEDFDEVLGFSGHWTPIPAAEVLHWYRRDEVGQVRGVPHITPSLTVAAELRAYEKAVQDAMEAAALFGVILFSTDSKAKTIVLQGETEITPKTMAAIPPGYQAAQINPNQPGNNHGEWKRSKLQQILLPLGMPTVVGLMDSTDTSYAGGRIDLQNFSAVISVTQGELERALLDPLIETAIREACLDPSTKLGKAPADLDWHWVWPAIPHVDPVKQALEQRMRKQDGSLDDAGAAAAYGLDAAVLRQNRQRETLENDAMLVARVKALQDALTASGQDPKSWPLLLAAAGALTAPGAYLQGAAAAQQSPSDLSTKDAHDNLAQDDTQDATKRSASPRGGRRAA